MKRCFAAVLMCTCAVGVHAQWQMQDSGTTASLRGISSPGKGIAWASGTNGTVLRTEDGGYVWQKCAVPPGAEKLDFRGVQGFDANTALVMSSGKGDASRLYKTTDGCKSWKLVFSNPDKEGFWDFLRGQETGGGHIETLLIGDPVDGAYTLYRSPTGTGEFERMRAPGLEAEPEAGLFAASNTSADIEASKGVIVFGGGGTKVRLLRICFTCKSQHGWQAIPLDDFVLGKGAGVFSIAHHGTTWVAVGGDYLKPNVARNNAAYSTDNGAYWTMASVFPGGYRSAVAYDARHKAWIAVGPTGTDASFDDGETWKTLKPGRDEPANDVNWNAVSLPFAVGPKGRIGILRPESLKNGK